MPCSPMPGADRSLFTNSSAARAWNIEARLCLKVEKSAGEKDALRDARHALCFCSVTKIETITGSWPSEEHF